MALKKYLLCGCKFYGISDIIETYCDEHNPKKEIVEMKKGKVQTNDDEVNVLVEHEDCESRHYSHLDFAVLCEKLNDKQINDEFNKITLNIQDKKDFLMKVNGFAISNVSSKENNIGYKDLFRYIKAE